MNRENANGLSHRLIKIEKIFYNGFRLWYEFRLEAHRQGVQAIKMEETARLHDYISVFEGGTDGKGKLNCYSVIKSEEKVERISGGAAAGAD